MKHLGWKLAFIICIILLIAMIIFLNTTSKKISPPKAKISKGEFKPQEKIQILELPPKEERPKEETVEAEKPPEIDIKDIPFEKLPKKTLTPKETPQEAEPSRELRTSPSPEELREIKQKGLVIY